jgi:hypothetical protein
VEVQCAAQGCGCWFWVQALDQRLPDGPFDCGADHEKQARLDGLCRRLADLGWEWRAIGEKRGLGCVEAKRGELFALVTWSSPDEFADAHLRIEAADLVTFDEATTRWFDLTQHMRTPSEELAKAEA